MESSHSAVALLVESQFQDVELLYPYYRLLEAGFRVDLIAPEKGRVYEGKYGYPVTSDRSVGECASDEYRGVIVPGGFAPDYMRRHSEMIRFVSGIHQAGGVVAAICHGPWILASADIVRDRKVTCFSAIVDDIKNAGGQYEDTEVVRDGRMVTSRKPDDLPAFCATILEVLGEVGDN